MRQALIAFATALMLVAGPLAAAAGGPVLVTVTGAITKPNRGAVDPDYDKLFAFHDVRFDNAAEFDLEALAALPQATVRTDFPMGGATVAFTGPLLRDVLAAAGAEGDTLVVQAMDGYAVEVPAAEMLDNGAVLALTRNGKPLGIGNLGPAQIVFPRADRPELAGMNDDWWIWQVFHIKVE